MKIECPICFSSFKVNNEKMVTCPYCDALLYRVDGIFKLTSAYPWWQKKDPMFETYRKEQGIIGMVKVGHVLERYAFKDSSWFLILNDTVYRYRSDFGSEPDKYDKKIEEKVSYIYGMIPVFTPLDFECKIYLGNNWAVKKEVASYSLWKISETSI
ncbi:MAG: hypothetical protein ACP5NL_00845 [Thermoplasmata archaeon]